MSEQSLEEVYNVIEWQSRVCWNRLGRCQSIFDLADLIQEGVIEFYRVLPRFDESRGSFKSFFLSCLWRKYSNLLRKARNLSKVEPCVSSEIDFEARPAFDRFVPSVKIPLNDQEQKLFDMLFGPSLLPLFLMKWRNEDRKYKMRSTEYPVRWLMGCSKADFKRIKKDIAEKVEIVRADECLLET